MITASFFQDTFSSRTNTNKCVFFLSSNFPWWPYWMPKIEKQSVFGKKLLVLTSIKYLKQSKTLQNYKTITPFVK